LSGADLALEFEALFDGVDPLETPQDDELIKVAESLTGAEANRRTTN
jgi:hypothetical protein